MLNTPTTLTPHLTNELRQRCESLRPLFPDERVFRGTVLSVFALSQLCPPGTLTTCLAELDYNAPPPPPLFICRDGAGDTIDDDTYIVLPEAQKLMQDALKHAGIVQDRPYQHAGDATLWSRMLGIKSVEVWAKCLKTFAELPLFSPRTAACFILRELENMAATNRKVLGDALPVGVAELLAELGNPQAGETILDAFAECGCVLAQAVLQATGPCCAVYMKRAPDALPHPDFDAPTMDVALALLALALKHHENTVATVENSCGASGIATLSSTLSPLYPTMPSKQYVLQGINTPRPCSADVVISLLPISGVYDAKAASLDAKAGMRFHRTVPPPASITAAGLTVLVEAMRQTTGRAVLATPLAPLFRTGPEAELRDALLSENLLDTVILLPGNVIYESPVQLAILLFDRRREAGNDRSAEDTVLFVDAHTLCAFGKNLNSIQQAHRAEIVQLVRERCEVPGKARLVSRAEVREQKVWMPQRYFAESRDMDMETTILLLQDELESVKKEQQRVRQLLISACS